MQTDAIHTRTDVRMHVHRQTAEHKRAHTHTPVIPPTGQFLLIVFPPLYFFAKPLGPHDSPFVRLDRGG